MLFKINKLLHSKNILSLNIVQKYKNCFKQKQNLNIT